MSHKKWRCAFLACLERVHAFLVFGVFRVGDVRCGGPRSTARAASVGRASCQITVHYYLHTSTNSTYVGMVKQPKQEEEESFLLFHRFIYLAMLMLSNKCLRNENG